MDDHQAVAEETAAREFPQTHYFDSMKRRTFYSQTVTITASGAGSCSAEDKDLRSADDVERARKIFTAPGARVFRSSRETAA